jgi:glyoxylase I family protein
MTITGESIGIVQYAHAGIAVTDLDRSLEFYCGVLGLRQVERPELPLVGAWLQLGDSQLHLAQIEQMPARDPLGVVHVAMWLPGKDAYDRAIAELDRRGVAPGTARPGAYREDNGTPVWFTILYDPDGNTVELTTQDPRPPAAA